jgi:thiol-disulfide isomerase/thioredoxin|tara:strand:- start:963 stop:1520 length:558 start_codon:yes stop_codon:yes gene_type:complete
LIKDGNLPEDTIQKTEILMNSARWLSITVAFLFVVIPVEKIHAQSSDILGPVTKEQILANDRIYEIYINRYKPDSASVDYLSAFPDSVTLMVFMGSWCRESKKYIPGLMKTLELADSERITAEYLGVDQQKKIPQILLKEFEIKYIPTIVVLKGNKELGRIVEKPHQLIETDLIQILDFGKEKNE